MYAHARDHPLGNPMGDTQTKCEKVGVCGVHGHPHMFSGRVAMWQTALDSLACIHCSPTQYTSPFHLLPVQVCIADSSLYIGSILLPPSHAVLNDYGITHIIIFTRGVDEHTSEPACMRSPGCLPLACGSGVCLGLRNT